MTLPYQKHSETSKEAARRNTKAAGIRADVLALVIDSRLAGLISDEIADTLDKIPNMIASRLQELEQGGLIVKLAETRKTRSRRRANVYVGRNYVQGREIQAPKKTLNREATENLAREFMRLMRENTITLGLLDKAIIRNLAKKAGI